MSSSLARKDRRKKKAKAGARKKTAAEPIPFQQEFSTCASVDKRMTLVAQAQVAVKEGFRAVFIIGTYACSAHGGGVHPLTVVASDEDLADSARGDIKVIIQRMRQVADELELQLAGVVTPNAAPFN